MQDIHIARALLEIAAAGAKSLSSVDRKNTSQWRKPNGSLLSEADLWSNEAIFSGASKCFPGVPIHSEESELLDWQYQDEVLIVDPLDGTTNFLRDIPLYSISIALVKKRKTEAAVVYAPELGVYFAQKDQGSFFTKNLHGKVDYSPVKYIERPLGASTISVSADQNDEESRALWWKWINLLRPPTTYRLRNLESAALELCWVASGKLDGYMHPTDKPWDVAAGALICQEVGIKLYSIDTNFLWKLDVPGIIAISPSIEEEIMLCLRSLLK